ncbi:MAG TPA: undecaprenyl-diphosphate phosphatase [Candidatus Saccharimonadales bacterium]|jgi:undecaprenyl-diphosphatase|nr:undecaprenyl-diphosphate phosphatase [Candidatus Saccharimonadales bacterium]
MNIFESIILGLVQGLTEFIPVSSSGHLVLTQWLFGHGSDQLLVESLDIGTVLALIIFFWPKIMHLAREVFIERNYRLARNILITAIPAGVAGLLLAGFIEKTSSLTSPLVVAIMLAIVGILMVLVEKLPRLDAVKNGEKLGAGRALLIGIAQMFALIPGVSRSGSTMLTGRLMGLSPAAAAEYSFMVSIPIMLGLIGKLLIKSSDREYLLHNLQPVLIGNIAAFVSGIIAIGFLMRYLSKHSLAVFGWYRIGLSVVVLLALLLQL